LHGAQSTAPARRREPLTYFSHESPIGQVFEISSQPHIKRRVAVVGLGIGTMASYAEPGEQWTFYEIDPAIERIARDSKYFSFVRDSRADIDIELGDARISLSEAPDKQFDLIVLDAFSSDAIPVHLLTREALALYLSRLADGGIMAFHISNRHLDLRPVLGGLARDAGLISLYRDGIISESDASNFKRASRWVVAAHNRTDLRELADDPHWKPLPVDSADRLWTDDFSNIISIMNFNLSVEGILDFTEAQL
jgi:hypothetical protein